MSQIWTRFRKTIFGDSIYPLIRHYNVYQKTYQLLSETQWWGTEELKNFQSEQLIKLIHHCYTNVPFYRKMFERLQLTPNDFYDVEELRLLPLLDKETVKKNEKDILARNYENKKKEVYMTGGSTGSPLRVVLEKDLWYVRQMAYFSIAFRRVAPSLYGKIVWLRKNSVLSQ